MFTAAVELRIFSSEDKLVVHVEARVRVIPFPSMVMLLVSVGSALTKEIVVVPGVTPLNQI